MQARPRSKSYPSLLTVRRKGLRRFLKQFPAPMLGAQRMTSADAGYGLPRAKLSEGTMTSLKFERLYAELIPEKSPRPQPGAGNQGRLLGAHIRITGADQRQRIPPEGLRSGVRLRCVEPPVGESRERLRCTAISRAPGVFPW